MTTDSELAQQTYDGDTGQQVDAPAAWDWRNVAGRNYITPSQDQGACQASTGFAIAAVMNARLRIQFSIALGQPNQLLVPDLSAGEIFYCGGGTCDKGLDVEQALGYAADKGVVPAYNIPYKPSGATCERPGPGPLDARATRISGFVTHRTMGSMKDAISSRGPIIALLRAYQDLKSYRSGVYRYDGKSAYLYMQTVSVIGYTTDGWLCKNSWGPGWGTGGVFCIAYGECGIDDESMWEINGFITTYPYGTVAGTPGSRDSSPMRILYRDNYGTIQDLSGSPPSATVPTPIDGLAAGSDPSFSIYGQSQLFAIRTDILGNLQFNTWNNGWSKVQWITGPEGVTDGPAAASNPCVVGGPYIIYRDADGYVHGISFNGSQWTWQQITGGTGIAAPLATGDPQGAEFSGNLYVFYRDTDGNIQDLKLSGGKWTVQQITGGGRTSAPAAVGNPYPTVYNSWQRIFYRDKNGAIQHIWFDGSKWGWDTLPPKVVAAGDVTSVGYSGYLHLFYRESRGYIWHVYWYGGRWNDEQLTGPGLSGGALAEGDPYSVTFGNEVHVLYRDINDNLSDAYWTGSTWTSTVRI